MADGIRAEEARIVAEFNKLEQMGSVDDYTVKFEELRSRMLLIDRFAEGYVVASFISGLSEEIQSFLALFDPQTLQQAIHLARKIEVTIEAIAGRAIDLGRKQEQTSEPLAPPVKLLTLAEMSARWEKELCYNCDKKFNPERHRCKNRQVFMLMTKEEEEAARLQAPDQPDTEESVTVQPMKFRGKCGEHRLRILLATGSGHSFLDEETAKKLGCPVEPASPMLFRPAGGRMVLSSEMVTEFKWVMEDRVFQYSSMRLMKLMDCDLVLGGDWVREHSPIEFNFEDRTLAFGHQGQKIQLRAVTETGVGVKSYTYYEPTKDEIKQIVRGLLDQVRGLSI